MQNSKLMIVSGKKPWTLAAMHLACAMARRGEVSVLLLKMVPVRHPLLLGTQAGLLDFSDEEAQVLAEMSATAEDYGVSLETGLFQYTNYLNGIVSAAAQLDVTTVITRISSSPIPYWSKIRRRWLRRQLDRQKQLLFTLDDLTPSLVRTPSTSTQNDLARS